MTCQHIPLGIIVATLAGLVCTSASAASTGEARPTALHHRIVCPLYLPAQTMKDVQQSGVVWTVNAEAWRLDGGGLLHGAPDEEGVLRPDVAQVKKRGTRDLTYRRWDLSVPHPHETWLFCGYGPVKLAHRIPVDATVCTATGGAEKGVRVATVFECR